MASIAARYVGPTCCVSVPELGAEGRREDSEGLKVLLLRRSFSLL